MKNPLIIPTAEPFFFPGGRTACLLIHGFTGTPKEMRYLGEYLAGQGYTVLGIRLAGHATNPADIVRMRWHDWVANVEDGLHLLKGCTDHVFVMGLSMGGALALLSAARYPVEGIVAMSTPYSLPTDWRIPYLRLISRFLPDVPKGPPDWLNPEVARDHVSYPTYPTRAIAELVDLLAEMRASLPSIQAPVLLMQSKTDWTIPAGSMPSIYARLGTSDKKMLWIENSGHVITREPAKEFVFRAAADFAARLSAGSQPAEETYVASG